MRISLWPPFIYWGGSSLWDVLPTGSVSWAMKEVIQRHHGVVIKLLDGYWRQSSLSFKDLKWQVPLGSPWQATQETYHNTIMDLRQLELRHKCIIWTSSPFGELSLSRPAVIWQIHLKKFSWFLKPKQDSLSDLMRRLTINGILKVRTKNTRNW